MIERLPLDALDERLAFVGTSGTGKTYAAKGFVERLLAHGAQVCIVDPLGVWWGLKAPAESGDPKAGFPLAIFGGRHADVEINEHAGAVVGRTIAQFDHSSIIDLDGLGSGAARRRFMLAFLDEVYEEKRRQGQQTEPLHIVFDEADLWAPQRPQPDATSLLGRMEEIVRRGRVAGFVPWVITQRPAVLNKDILSQADTLIAMKLTSAQDRAALAAWIDGQADKAEAKRIIADLPKLTRGTGYVWAPGQSILKKTQFPPIATFDSSRTPKRGEHIKDPTRRAAIDASALGAIQAAIKSAIEAKAGPKNQGAGWSPEAIAKAEEDGYQRGLAEGQAAGLVKAQRALEQFVGELRIFIADHTIYAKVKLFDEATAPENKAHATAPEIGPIAEGSEPAFKKSREMSDTGKSFNDRRSQTPRTKVSELLLIAVRHWPAKLTWSQLATIAGRKARGGHFNGEVKNMREAGLVVMDGDSVVVTDCGFAAAGGKPSRKADLAQAYLDGLPNPSNRMFEQLLKHGTLRTPALATAIGMKPTGGHWNSGLSTLARCGLIAKRGDVVELNRKALAA
jgi:SpoVK/Ycf46/Vps4 family AAA+-type ATPase